MTMFEATELTATPQPQPIADLDRLMDVHVDVTVELGRTRMTLGEALEIGPGAVIPLGATAGSPLLLEVNGQLVARGEVVVIDEVYGLQITEIVERGSGPVTGAQPEPAGPAGAEAPAGDPAPIAATPAPDEPGLPPQDPPAAPPTPGAGERPGLGDDRLVA